ncbi:NAD(P)H-dependent oxidoreductase [Companilactobacillus ginsenosidimutans]|uniref:Flavodoxin n=1 Tax=Companilactobacillus ginsenosidimutans TaxID=1007676 RepID=A0A0H4QJB9_9LACO|nr:NAD(P)H-dependent oxidoreductase [Companilactobacillus ginsenosidimutans]AKP67141.1 flavodoxin [Companilactobacillus ginsenosidimutans]
MKTIIYTHPYQDSFNHAIQETMEKIFADKHQESQVIDLYGDNFDPVMSRSELAKYSSGKTSDPLVSKYQRMIADSDELVFIFPIWWHMYPAMLKGFIDKVMLHGFAYDSTDEIPWQGLLSYINRVTVITTSTVTKDYLVEQCGNPIQGVFINRTLDDLGILPEKSNWIHYGKVDKTPKENHVNFLNELADLYQNGQK